MVLFIYKDLQTEQKNTTDAPVAALQSAVLWRGRRKLGGIFFLFVVHLRSSNILAQIQNAD